MKKKFAAIIAAAFFCTLTACREKSSESQNTEQNSESAAVEITTEQEISAAPQTDADSVKSSETTETEAVTETVTSMAVPETETGIFDAPENEQDEESIISAAQKLFDEACRMEWNYTVGSPYSIDTEQFITNTYGWEFYLIIDEGINSLDDIRADYHKVFSENYPDTLDELFIESDGHVYCLSGARGSDIFYESSAVSEITGRTEDEINFNVVNSYKGDDFGNEAYTENSEFTIVKDSNGEWKVSVFRLPY